MPELGPARLDRELQKYIWSDKDHLSLKDLWEYMNRYTYLPRLKNRSVLTRTVQAAVGGLLPGPFAYAEGWDETTQTYRGLVIDNTSNAQVVIDSESVIVKPDVAEANRIASSLTSAESPYPGPDPSGPLQIPVKDDDDPIVSEETEEIPTRFIGTVMISAERPTRDIRQVVEGIVEHLTDLPDNEVSLKLEIDAEVPSGLDQAKVRTLNENANTLGFIEKTIK